MSKDYTIAKVFTLYSLRMPLPNIDDFVQDQRDAFVQEQIDNIKNMPIFQQTKDLLNGLQADVVDGNQALFDNITDAIDQIETGNVDFQQLPTTLLNLQSALNQLQSL